MLYKKNSAPELTQELFRNPTCEYRGTPFWAWNSDLKSEELQWQIEVFKEMGLGGFHMHVRTGMSTKYLSDEFMQLVKDCVDKADREEMLAWLYDEDRWPSGAAGGLVTKDEENRARCLLLTTVPCDNSGADTADLIDSRAEGGRNGKGYLIACYDVVLDADGCLASYDMIGENDEAKGTKWYAYLKIHAPSPWYNNQTYLDTLNPKAVERFVEVTHDKYKEKVGYGFGETVPAIFTDEPQFTRKKQLPNSTDTSDVLLPWTDDIPETYKAQYGSDIIPSIPELFWDLPYNKPSLARYRYHDHISERFAQAFADTCGKWCRENGIALTGHMMEEPTLESQTAALGDAMRSYRGFDLPGIDMLCANFEFTTAKQAQSAVHQFGYEGMLSELYGVTGWDYDFRGYKLHGDWQACLGVTIRVPHLSWVAMGGEAKRDYPASIHYQSPWYKKFSYVEDHFARVNTALTRGKPVVKVGVIHPVESYWLHWGPNDKTDLIRSSMDEKFLDLAQWLLKGSIDFNYISESLLPDLCESGSAPLKVGKMEYDAIVVPDCETLRSTTLERLEAFRKAGGKLIFMGSAPYLEDGVESERGKKLCAESQLIPFDREKILTALEDNRTVTLRLKNGKLSNGFIYQLRRDNGCNWLFVSRCCEPENKDMVRSKDLRITVKGEFTPCIYNTLNGEIEAAEYEYIGGNTVISKEMYEYDSLLLKLVDGKTEPDTKTADAVSPEKETKLPAFVPFTLSEPNVLLLDMAEFKVDDGEFMKEEEILRLDNVARKIIGLPERGGNVAQPWVVENEPPTHTVTLRFRINSTIEYTGAMLALEDAEKAKIVFNGNEIANDTVGWFTDKDIKTVKLTDIVKGENVLEITLPIGKRTNTEWCYLLGNFGVSVAGRKAQLIPMPEKIAFGSIVNQGMPFYGGNVTYHLDVEGDSIQIEATRYRGGIIDVKVDGELKGNIAYPPYMLSVDGLGEGSHKLDVTLYGNRYNCFGAVHMANAKRSWHGPDAWRTQEDEWSYEYILKDVGILTAPVIKTR